LRFNELFEFALVVLAIEEVAGEIVNKETCEFGIGSVAAKVDGVDNKVADEFNNGLGNIGG